MLIVHADMPPTDSDWTRMMMVRNAHLDKLRSVLVIAQPRAGINASQRSDAATFMKSEGRRIVVVTDSAWIRGLARAVSLLGVNVRAFAPNELSRALEFALVPASSHADFVRRIETMKAQLGVNPRGASPPDPRPRPGA